MPEQIEELPVAKIHCRTCSLELEKTIAKMNGIHEVQVNFDDNKARIRYNTELLDGGRLKQTLTKLGQQIVHPDLSDSSPDNRVLFTAISGAWLVIGLFVNFFTQDLHIAQIGFWDLRASSLLYLAAVSFGGLYVVRGGIRAVAQRRLGIDALMTIAIVGAVAIGQFVEAASLAFLYSVAELLENYAINRARNSLRALMELAPHQAIVWRNDQEFLVPVEAVQVDEIVFVRPGEKVPLDGVVVEGTSAVNQAPITGESVPIEKSPGDPVYASSLNEEGFLEIRVSKVAKDSTLSKIIQLVAQAESQKAPSEKFVERFGRYYTPTVVVLALLIAVVPPLAFSAPFITWFLRAITLLVISCPCALLISTPVSVVSGITAAARHGVLIKGGAYLEAMGQVKAIAVDKTGTLTTGQLQVTDVIPLNGANEAEVLRVSASLEAKSKHPIAQTIVRAADPSSLMPVKNFRSLTAQGVEGELNGKRYRVGKPELFSGFESEAFVRLQNEAKTVVAVGTEHQLLGLIAVADQVRAEAAETVRALQQFGLEVVMITGDNEGTAKAVAAELGLSRYHAGVLPEDKLKEIKKLEERYGKVAMVGDGVNDAPALAAASVGIAMGAMGTDAALETADIALMADDLSKLPYLIKLSRKSRRVIQQNIWFSILTKFSLGLGIIPGYVTLVVAVLVGDLGATLAVTGNALRLARQKTGTKAQAP